MYICVQKNCNRSELGSNLPQVVATDFFLKTVPAETPVTQCSPCYSAVSSSLTNPLPDCSNYSPFCHTHYLTLDQYFTSLFRPDPLPATPLETNTSLLQRYTAESSRELGRNACLEEAEQQAEASVAVPYPLFKLLTQFPFISFLSISILSLLPFSILSLLPLHHPFFLF